MSRLGHLLTHGLPLKIIVFMDVIYRCIFMYMDLRILVFWSLKKDIRNLRARLGHQRP